MGPTPVERDPIWPFPSATPTAEDEAVQVISSARTAKPPFGAVLVGFAAGTILLVGGLFLGWVAFATPVLTGLTQTGQRAGMTQLALGGAVWAFTLVAPPSFAIVGALRLGRVARAVSAKPAPRAIHRVAGVLGDEFISASNLHLPDGRVLRDLVIGPFGLAVVTELPPPTATRHTGTSWEIRRSDGRWAPWENPLERTARDVERVRRWVGSADRDYVVKVYGAVVTSDPTVTRTPACPVLSSDQIGPWLASLPPSRIFNAERREDIADHIRAIV